ncbi:MAG: sigma factor [Candidatus Sulfotelmatobacter sp.]
MFPAPADELALHERVLNGDPVAPVDAFQAFTDPIVNALVHDLFCTDDEAYDSGIDALLAYLEEPSRYDHNRGRLSTYLTGIAKKKAIDRLRSRTARKRREEDYAINIELRAANPNEITEVQLDARILWRKVEETVPSERDRRALGLILSGERSTNLLAEALEITGLPTPEQQHEVKQHRDRLLKILERLGKRIRDNDTTTSMARPCRSSWQ